MKRRVGWFGLSIILLERLLHLPEGVKITGIIQIPGDDDIRLIVTGKDLPKECKVWPWEALPELRITYENRTSELTDEKVWLKSIEVVEE